MTTPLMSPSLKAAILAAVALYEQDEVPVRDLASGNNSWRLRGRRMLIGMRFETGRILPTVPVRRSGWRGATRGANS